MEQSKKERMFIEHTLDKHAFGYDNKTFGRIRRYRNLLRQNHRQMDHLHLRNNPYPEDHPRSYGECPRMSFLPRIIHIFFSQFLCTWIHIYSPPLGGVYHRNKIWRSHAEDLFPRERDMAFSYISSRETRL